MLKSISLVFTCLFLSIATFAQSVNWSKTLRDEDKRAYEQVLTSSKKRTLVLSSLSAGKREVLDYSIVTFDKDLNKGEVYPITTGNLDNRIAFECAVNLKDKIVLVYSEEFYKEQKVRLFAYTFDKHSMKQLEGRVTLDEIDFSVNRRWYFKQATLVASLDSSNFMLHYEMPTKQLSESKLGWVMLNANFEKTTNGVASMPYHADLIDLDHVTLSKQGDFYLSLKLYEKMSSLARDLEEPYTFQTMRYSATGEKLAQNSFVLDGVFATSYRLAFNPDQQLIAYGLYHPTKEREQSVQGAYMYFLNPKSLLKEKGNASPLMDDFYFNEHQKNLPEGRRRSARTLESNLFPIVLDLPIFRPNGEVIFLAEQVHQYQVSLDYGRFGSEDKLNDMSGTIFVILMNKEGKLVWNRQIPKKQNTSDDQGSSNSYLLLVSPSSLTLLFNDAPLSTQYNFSKQDLYTGQFDAFIAWVKIDADGGLEKGKLKGSQDNDELLMPAKSFELRGDKLVLLAYTKFGFVLGTFKP